MPSSPITKKVQPLSDNWVQLQKTIIPDQATASYWSVWYDVNKIVGQKEIVGTGTAWLMWCPFGDDPSINDSWSHAEEINGDCKNVITAIEAIHKVSFHEDILEHIPSE